MIAQLFDVSATKDSYVDQERIEIVNVLSTLAEIVMDLMSFLVDVKELGAESAEKIDKCELDFGVGIVNCRIDEPQELFGFGQDVTRPHIAVNERRRIRVYQLLFYDFGKVPNPVVQDVGQVSGCRSLSRHP